jgi:hypothetical protein
MFFYYSSGPGAKLAHIPQRSALTLVASNKFSLSDFRDCVDLIHSGKYMRAYLRNAKDAVLVLADDAMPEDQPYPTHLCGRPSGSSATLRARYPESAGHITSLELAG